MNDTTSSVRARMLRGLATVALTSIYGAAIVANDLARRLVPRSGRSPSGVLLLTGTFHNPNWYISHVTPLSACGFRRIVLVADGHVVDAIPGVEIRVPPEWALRLFTRAGAKFLLLLLIAIKLRPSVIMGYHIFPAALSALVTARLGGALAAYQVTAGPLELEGGGWHAENRLLTSLGRPSALIERLAFAVTRRFDLVVVRGSQARRFVTERCRYAGDPMIITGSVGRVEIVKGYAEREFDVLFVGRLTEYKRPDRFVAAMTRIAKTAPGVRAIVVGDGPDRADIEAQIDREGLRGNVTLLGTRDDVPALMSRSRVLLQTSRWEGVSIAVLEAMMHGVVPVVSDVGDMRDAIEIGESGYIVAPDDIDAYAAHVAGLLADPQHWEALSRAGRERAEKRYSTGAITAAWHDALVRARAL